MVVEGNSCQMDLVPIWLKRQGRMKVVKILAFWGNEGESFHIALSFHFLNVMLEI